MNAGNVNNRQLGDFGVSWKDPSRLVYSESSFRDGSGADNSDPLGAL